MNPALIRTLGKSGISVSAVGMGCWAIGGPISSKEGMPLGWSQGRSPAQGAIAWLWARSDKTLPIPGFKTVAQVEENCRAMHYGPLNKDQMQEIDRVLC